MARLFNEVLYEAVLDAQIAQIAGYPQNEEDRAYARHLRKLEYEYSKISRPFFMQIQLNFTGAAGQKLSDFTPSVDHDLLVVAASCNAPTTGLVITLRDTYTSREFQMTPVPVTAHFANVANNTERYFRFPTSFKIGARSKLQLTAVAPAGFTQLVTFSFMCVWAERSIRGAEPARIELDKYVYGQIDSDQMWTSPLDLTMDVDFTGIAAGAPLPRPVVSTETDEPVLIYALQHTFDTKSDVLTLGPTIQFQTRDISFDWSPTQQLIWTFANYVNEPEQWITLPKPVLVPPNTQIQATVTNGTGAGQVTTLQQVIFLGKRL